MGTGRRLSRRKRLKVNSRKAARPVVIWIVGLLALGLAAFLLRQRFGLLRWQRVPPYYASAEQAKPFPKTLPPSAFNAPKMIRAYEIATRIPDVLVQLPSYCVFVRRHHHSLLECFTNDDAVRCDVCVKEVYLADEMSRGGKSPSAIRAAIISGAWKSMKVEGNGTHQ